MTGKKKIGLFLGLTLAFSLLSYIPILTTDDSDLAGLLVMTLMWSPGAAALLTQLIATRSLRGLGWGLGKARWLALAYLLPLAYALPVYGFTWLSGLGTVPSPTLLQNFRISNPAVSPAAMLVMFLFMNATLGVLVSLLFALGEEIGWRGLLVPELAKQTTFTKTALISGGVWALWHMPLVLAGTYNNPGTPVWFSALCFTVLVVAISFPFAWLALKSGSLWTAALLHASHNLFIQGVFDVLTGQTPLTPLITGEFGIGLAITAVVVGYIFWRQRAQVEGAAGAAAPQLLEAAGRA